MLDWLDVLEKNPKTQAWWPWQNISYYHCSVFQNKLDYLKKKNVSQLWLIIHFFLHVFPVRHRKEFCHSPRGNGAIIYWCVAGSYYFWFIFHGCYQYTVNKKVVHMKMKQKWFLKGSWGSRRIDPAANTSVICTDLSCKEQQELMLHMTKPMR